MADRPSDPAGQRIADLNASSDKPAEPSADIHELRALLDQCSSAHRRAEALGEKFLSYLLGMATEEVRMAIQRIAPNPDEAHASGSQNQ